MKALTLKNHDFLIFVTFLYDVAMHLVFKMFKKLFCPIDILSISMITLLLLFLKDFLNGGNMFLW